MFVGVTECSSESSETPSEAFRAPQPPLRRPEAFPTSARVSLGETAPPAEFNGPAFQTARTQSDDHRKQPFAARVVNGAFHGPGNTVSIAGRSHAAPASERPAAIL